MAERSIWDRMRGAAMLDIATYEEVEHDDNLTTQAAIVVLIAALARGVGGFNDGENGIIVGVVAALFSWLVWAGITYLIGAFNTLQRLIQHCICLTSQCIEVRQVAF